MQAYRTLLADRAFRRFWLALLLVMLADEIVRTTLVWHVYEVTRSPEAVGLLQVCLTGPVVVAGLLAGWLLDHYPRARVMAADTAARAMILLVVIICALADIGGVLPFYALAVVQGALLMILLGGAPAAIAELVGPEGRSAANAMEQLGFSIAFAAGPVVGGQILAHAPVWVALGATALCYAAFATLVRGMRLGGGSGSVTAAKVAWRESGVLHPTVAIITVMFLVFNIGTGAFVTLLPILVDRVLHAEAGTYGGLLGLTGVGISIGVLLGGAIDGGGKLAPLIAIGQVATGLVLVPLGLMLLTDAPGLPLVATCAFLFGMLSGPLTAWAQTIRMRHIAPQWRGRAFASLRMIMQSGRPIGGALAGAALAMLPLAACLFAIAAIIATPALAALAHPAMRREPAAPLR